MMNNPTIAMTAASRGTPVTTAEHRAIRTRRRRFGMLRKHRAFKN